MNEQEMKNILIETFDTVAGGYDKPALRYFASSAAHIPIDLALRGDEHVLDVATGTGHAAIALAGVLNKGQVTGIDFSEGMLARARAKASEAGVRNLNLHRMDMQNLQFPDRTFDAATMCFSLFFVEDMEGLLRHVSDKVKPGGKVIATSFLDGSFSPLADLFFKRLKAYGVEPPVKWRKLSTAEECSALFAAAGLLDVQVQTRDLGYHLSSAQQWWDLVWNAGFRRYLAGMSTSAVERFISEHMQEIDELANSEGIWLEVKVIYSQGSVGKSS